MSPAAPHTPTDAIRVVGLHFAYPSPLLDGHPIAALNGVDLNVAAGEFVAVMGRVGAGKTTLCLALNGAIPHAVDGELTGNVFVHGQDTRTTPMGQLSMQVGLVFENAQAQLFNPVVIDEVAFGLEAIGLPVDEIERRIAQALDFVGLEGFEQRVPQMLSGGEQKRLALACVLAMRPTILVLDEPTSGLDPRGRRQALEIIERLRQQRNMAVIMVTQDAQAAARFADRIVVLRHGRIAAAGTPADIFAQVEQMDAWGLDVPQMARLAQLLARRTQKPFTFLHLAQAKTALRNLDPAYPGRDPNAAQPIRPPRRADTAYIQIERLDYRYPHAGRPALDQVSLDIAPGDWLAVIGVNGSGKSTLLKHLNGLFKPTAGAVRVNGRDTRHCSIGELGRMVSYLPQNPDQLIFCATVRQEVAYGPKQLGLRGVDLDERVAETLALLKLQPYADHPPAVLSYGLRRQVALASILAMNAPVLALDEPTAGLDRATIAALLGVIEQRHKQGAIVVMITHDLALASRYANRTAVLCAGRLAACAATPQVLTDLDLLNSVGLTPLPVTTLAHALRLAAPLPLTARQLADRLCPPEGARG